jgi:hypothetical protein
MKKLILTAFAVVGIAVFANAQGFFIIDSSANHGNGSTPTSSTGGLVFINGVLDTATDINLGILWGTTANSLTALNIDPTPVNGGAYTGNINWIASQPSGAADITFNGDGTLTDPNGIGYTPPGSTAGETIYLQLQAWTGTAGSYAAASVIPGVAVGQTSVFSIVLAAGSAPQYPDISGMSSLNLVSTPEPSTLAMAGLGGFGMLMAMRRKKA